MKYYLIAGEASGDLHASNLMKGLAAEDPQAQFRFWGGEKMAAVGGELVHHYKEGAVMGASEVLRKGGKLLANLRNCKRDLLAWHPDAVILVDYPGFNMKIARFAHSHGLKVFYYIAPKTWASREGRNRELKRYVDMLYIVFPFEIPYFESKGIPFVYKGNPLVEAIDKADRTPVCEGPSIAILPGSRKAEISRMMPVCMEVADALHALPAYKDFKFLVARASGLPGMDRAARGLCFTGLRPHLLHSFRRPGGYSEFRHGIPRSHPSGHASGGLLVHFPAHSLPCTQGAQGHGPYQIRIPGEPDSGQAHLQGTDSGGLQRPGSHSRVATTCGR